LTVGDVRKKLLQEREHALDTRDPIAIKLAGERADILMEILEGHPEAEEIDPKSFMLSLRQTARVLGFDPREVRQLIQDGRIRARKHGDQWQIPLDVVL
jgi:hypothetical protein